jgi:cytochrome c-type biogenesis protein
MLAFITIQQEVARGLLYIVLFGIGHCIPIVIAGSSMALVKRLLETARFQQSTRWFRRLGGVAIGIFGVYFIMRPFWEA